MLTQPLNHQCVRSLARPDWANFCEIFSEEHRNQQVTIQVIEPNAKEIDTFDPMPLHSIGYSPFRTGNILTITVGNRGENTYEHIVAYPKEIHVFYERGEQIFAVVITDKRRAKTVVYFEEDAVVIHGTGLIF